MQARRNEQVRAVAAAAVPQPYPYPYPYPYPQPYPYPNPNQVSEAGRLRQEVEALRRKLAEQVGVAGEEEQPEVVRYRKQIDEYEARPHAQRTNARMHECTCTRAHAHAHAHAHAWARTTEHVYDLVLHTHTHA